MSGWVGTDPDEQHERIRNLETDLREAWERVEAETKRGTAAMRKIVDDNLRLRAERDRLREQLRAERQRVDERYMRVLAAIEVATLEGDEHPALVAIHDEIVEWSNALGGDAEEQSNGG